MINSKMMKSIVPTVAISCFSMWLIWAIQVQGQSDGRLKAHRVSVPGVKGLVTSANPLPSIAGTQMLMKGGTAADAAVAVATTLNVVEPQSSGLGGNGFMTIYEKSTGKVYSLGTTGAAPNALNPKLMSPETLSAGIKAGIVPGNIGGWIVALDRFGKLSLAEVLEPAIGYAENGHPINERLVSAITGQKDFFEKWPTSSKMFLPHGRIPEIGEVFKLPNLANTFKKLVYAEQTALKQGNSRSEALMAAFDRFYKGDIAEEMVDFFQKNQGDLTLKDFAAYQPIWADPVHTTYRGYDVYTSPPTSRGGLEVAMQLNLIEEFDIAELGHGSAKSIHLMAEAIKVTKADIYEYVADQKFADVPMSEMLSKEYASIRRKLINKEHAIPYPAHGNIEKFTNAPHSARQAEVSQGPTFKETFEPSYDTTSFSIVDQFGNAIACTPTLGGGFGNRVVAGDTGILLNNGMRLGSTSPYPDDVNYVRAGQIPILNNSPLVILKDGSLKMVYGTPGGETIGQTQFQVLINVLDFEMSIQEALEAPRFRLDANPNFYKPGAGVTLAIESRVSREVLDQLETMGHNINVLPEWTSGVGGMQGILIDIEHGTMTGGADPRRAGYAIGW